MAALASSTTRAYTARNVSPIAVKRLWVARWLTWSTAAALDPYAPVYGARSAGLDVSHSPKNPPLVSTVWNDTSGPPRISTSGGGDAFGSTTPSATPAR